MKKKDLVFLRGGLMLLLMALCFCTVQAQVLKVTGQVKDQVGEPLIGVNVIEKGTTNGTVTDINGQYSVFVKNANAVLSFSYIGYKTQEIALAGKKVVNITLKDDSEALEEVVVIGYGTARKKDLTGSVIQVRPDNIAMDNPKTVQDILRGTAGLSVGYDASAKGGGSMSIRGQRSVYTDGGHNDPLLILDGMMFYGELSEINPDDIEQIDILKDASSAAVYGAKAANGVIIVTTKKGKQGKPVVNLSANVGFVQRAGYRKRWETPEAYLQHYQDWKEVSTYGSNPETGEWEAYRSGNYIDRPGYYANPAHLSGVSLEQWRGYSGNDADESDLSIWARRLGFNAGSNALQNLLDGRWTDWDDITFRTGLQQDYNASVSGATEKANYYLSVGYLNNQGVKIDDDYTSIRANMKVNMNVNKYLEVGANVNFQNRSDGSIGVDEDYQMRNCPYADYKDADGNLVQYPLDGSYSQRGYNYEFQKQYLELEKGYTTFNTVFDAKLKLPFGITYTFNIAPRFQWFYDRYFMSADLPGSVATDRGVNREQAKRFDYSLNNTINWDYTFSKVHHVTLTLVQEAEERRYWSDRIEARNILPSDALGFHNTQNASKDASSFSTNDTHSTADALMARVFYAYDNRYMLTASVRRDGYSAFGSSNPYATFPSIALGWTFTNEKFWKWDNIMDNGKLRLSYGKNGNRSLSDPYVALANLYSGAGKTMGYIQADGKMEEVKYLMAQRLANPNLQWEKTASWNAGLDFSFLQGRITGALDVYVMQTKDMIMSQKLPNFTGFSTITTNLGQVDNNGVELTLNTQNIKTRNFEWTSTVNFSYNKNRIKHLYNDYKNVTDADGNVIGQKEADDETNGWFIGRPISNIWDYKVTGIWQKDQWEEAAKYGQKPGDPIVANLCTDDDIINADGSRTPVYNSKDKTFLGQTVAPYRWAFRNEFSYKDFTLALNMYSYMGQKKTSTNYLNNDDDGGRMSYALANKEAKTYWTLDNATNHYGRIDTKGPTGAQTPPMVYNAGFIRLDNLTLGYTLPKELTKKVGIERIRLYGTIKNLAMITFDKYWEYGDIEANGLAVRSYTLGVNFTF